MSALDSLRDLLPPGEIEVLEAMAAEVQEAASSPRVMRRWAREIAAERLGLTVDRETGDA